MRQLTFIATTFFIAVSLPVPTAGAHVLVKDVTGEYGAILHIIPDDDPIAGKTATLYLDAQTELNQKSKVSLTISNDEFREEVGAEADGSLVTADFVFPEQGVYLIRYVISSPDEKMTFESTTRISRGTVGASSTTQRHTWAEALFIGGSISIAVIGIVAFNRRVSIAKQSTF